MAELAEDGILTPEEILTFGPCVEAQVWTPAFIQEARAPIAVAAGRPKFGKIFDDQGRGKMVTIRPCMSRGRLVRGLRPVYTPQMLEKNAGVFDGWPMFMDHVPPELAKTMAKYGRSVKELGGQVIKGHWARDFVQESDSEYGYRPGAVISEIWATPMIRKTVGENPGLLHTSINAWPTSGKPGPVPWRPGTKGMIIEGIRRQPQGSVDYVVRGGAGGKLLVAEGLEDEGEWPELGEWAEQDRVLVVSVAESLYASPRMADLTLPTEPSELHAWLQEHAPHLVPALAEANDGDADDEPKGKGSKQTKPKPGDDTMNERAITSDDVTRIVNEALAGQPSVDEFEQRLREQTEQTLNERESQRGLSAVAQALIESAEGIPAKWKADLKARYAMLPSGPPSTLLVESETDGEGNTLSTEQVLENRVKADLDHVRDLIAEARGKPRVTGEGGKKRDPADSGGRPKPGQSHWRREFASMGLAENESKAGEMFGLKVEG